MALIKCPECGQEVSDTAASCVKCGFRIKQKRKFNKTASIIAGSVVLLACAAFLLIKLLSNKETYPEIMKILNQEKIENVLVLLGDDYRIENASAVKFYVYNNIELDGVIYETVHVTEKYDGSLYEIGFEFSVDDLSKIEKYAKDISKYYGSYEKSKSGIDSYNWRTSKSLNPSIWIHGKSSPYDIVIKLN